MNDSVTIHLSSRAADVEAWRRGEVEGEVVKRNDARIVWRLPIGEPALYVKRFPRRRIGSRALKEARILQTFEEAGVPGPPLVAVIRDDEWDYIVTEELAGTEELRGILERNDPRVREILERLAGLVRRLHEAGLDHRDLHDSNILVRGTESFLIDVHRAGRLRAGERVPTGLVFLTTGLCMRSSRTETLRFLKHYGMTSRKEREMLLEALRHRRRQYLRSRDRRCLKTGTRFVVQGGLFRRREIDPERLLTWIESGEKILVDDGGGESLWRSPEGSFLKKTKPRRARRAWVNAHRMEVRGLPVPKHFAHAEDWIAGEWVDGPTLLEYVRQSFGALDRAGRNAFIGRLARAVQEMHRQGVSHRDLKSPNLIVRGEAFLFVDLDRVRFGEEVSVRDRRTNLAQINASVPVPVTKTDRWRFLLAYIGRDRKLWEGRRELAREVMRLTVERKHFWP